jgi:protein CpxP
MRKGFCLLAISSLLGIGAAMGAAQDQQAAPAPQEGHGPRWQMDPEQRVKMLTKRLNLTSDQQAKLLPILTDQKQQFESIRNDTSLTQKDRAEKMRALREDSDTKIQALLTDSQKQTYAQMKAQAREHMHQRHDERAPNSDSQPNN